MQQLRRRLNITKLLSSSGQSSDRLAWSSIPGLFHPSFDGTPVKPSLFQLLQIYNLHTKKQANEIRTGNILDIDGRLLQVLKYSHSQTGRQLGNIQLELRDVMTKSKHPLRLRPSDMVDIVRLEEKKFQFLYQEDHSLHCMDPETFEQVAISKDILGSATGFLTEGGDLFISFHQGLPITATLPPTVILKIAEAAPHFRGESQAPQSKPAKLETGATLSVPSFVVAGDAVVIDTTVEGGKFVKRSSSSS